MTGETQRAIQNLLLERRNQALGLSAKRRAQDSEVEGATAAPEMIDVAQTLEQLDRDRVIKEQERRDLVAIERALAKIAVGSFGTCEDCEEEIPERRLFAVPEARLCAHCQALEERDRSRHAKPGHARFGSPDGEIAA